MGSVPINAAGTMSGVKARISDAIGQASQRTGVDFDYLWNQARVESSLDPAAKARTSSAAGLFQFIEQSWLGTVKKHGAEHGYGQAADAIQQRADGRYVVGDAEARQAILAMRYDPDASAAMAAEFASDNADYLASRIGRSPNSTDLYFAHFLGAAGASRFLKAAAASPDASAAAQFPTEAAANHAIFYARGGEPRSFAQVYALMGEKLGSSGVPVQQAGGFARELRLQSTAPDAGTTWQGGSANPFESPLTTSPFTTAPFATAPFATAPFTTAAFTTAMSLAGRQTDMLRPSPQSARLAYMLVVSTLDA